MVKLFTLVFLLYSILAAVFMVIARIMTSPTGGGSSPSELLEGLVPGGVTTLVVGWIIFLIASIGVWVGQRVRHKLPGRFI